MQVNIRALQFPSLLRSVQLPVPHWEVSFVFLQRFQRITALTARKCLLRFTPHFPLLISHEQPWSNRCWVTSWCCCRKAERKVRQTLVLQEVSGKITCGTSPNPSSLFTSLSSCLWCQLPAQGSSVGTQFAFSAFTPPHFTLTRFHLQTLNCQWPQFFGKTKA